MKKLAFLLSLLLALTVLSGCGQHEHQWEDATCTEPETCSVCGETRGEALGHRWKSNACTEPETCVRCGETRGTAPGHDWLPADCDTPETCSRCGETQGEVLGHDWLPADCGTPETCSRCGETRGEALGHDALPADYWTASVCSRCGTELAPALTPDFEAAGLLGRFMQAGQTYDYRTICYEDTSYFTVGKATVTDYSIVPSAAGLEAKDGYEWRCVTMSIVFSDENANNYGMSVSRVEENYYNVREHDDTLAYLDENGLDETFNATWKGTTYTCRMMMDASFSEWTDNSCTYTCSFYAQVPVGYDGVVVGLRNRGLEWPEGAYITDLDNSETLFFRMS